MFFTFDVALESREKKLFGPALGPFALGSRSSLGLGRFNFARLVKGYNEVSLNRTRCFVVARRNFIGRCAQMDSSSENLLTISSCSKRSMSPCVSFSSNHMLLQYCTTPQQCRTRRSSFGHFLESAWSSYGWAPGGFNCRLAKVNSHTTN